MYNCYFKNINEKPCVESLCIPPYCIPATEKKQTRTKSLKCTKRHNIKSSLLTGDNAPSLQRWATQTGR